MLKYIIICSMSALLIALPQRTAAQCQSCEILGRLVDHALLRNGNFYISFVDLVYTYGAHTLRIDRTYNSKASFYGMFGVGWGYDFGGWGETYPDGSFVYHLTGGGSDIHFYPDNFDVNAKSRAVNEIYTLLLKEADSPRDALSMKKRLTKDPVFFIDSWTRLVKQRKIAPFKVPEGTMFSAASYMGYMTLEKLRDGYVLWDELKQEKTFFGEEGHMEKLVYKDSAILYLKSDSLYRIRSVYNNQNEDTLFLFYNGSRPVLDSALVKSGIAEIAKSRYRYKSYGSDVYGLVYSEDGSGITNEFDYDDRINMTRVRYMDSTFMTISYWGRDTFDNVRSVKERDGRHAEIYYTLYGNYHADSSRIKVFFFQKNNKLDSTITLNVFEKISGGESRVSRMIVTKDDMRPKEYYFEDGRIISYVSASDTVSYRYDDRAFKTSEESSGYLKKYQYNVCGRVSQVVRLDKKYNTMDTLEVVYNDSCNARRVCRKNKKLEINYHKNMISRLQDGENEVVFEYGTIQTFPDRLTKIILNGKSAPVQYINSATGQEIDTVVVENPLFKSALAVVKDMIQGTEEILKYDDYGFSMEMKELLMRNP